MEPFQDFGRLSLKRSERKRHVTAARREYRSRDCCTLEFELGISVASVSHVIFAC